jgi:hypothetical protein
LPARGFVQISGRLSPDHPVRGCRPAGSSRYLDRRRASWLEEVDTDGDGAISAEEIAALGDRFASKVDDLDNGDGAVSAAELTADLEARKSSILEALDANANGDLQPEELAAAQRGCMDTDEEEEAAEQVEAEALVLGSGEAEFLRGDASGDGRVDISTRSTSRDPSISGRRSRRAWMPRTRTTTARSTCRT